MLVRLVWAAACRESDEERGMIALIGSVEALVLAALGALHFYWATGGQRARLATVPEIEGRAVLSPGPLACAAVGVSLLFAAALVCWTARVWAPAFIPLGAARAGTAVLAAVFTVRAIGDRKYVGFFKQVRDTGFARLDSRIYSPLCLLLGLGAAAVVVF
jgi:hypothetical protein